jgi:hypothetical protein
MIVNPLAFNWKIDKISKGIWPELLPFDASICFNLSLGGPRSFPRWELVVGPNVCLVRFLLSPQYFCVACNKFFHKITTHPNPFFKNSPTLLLISQAQLHFIISLNTPLTTKIWRSPYRGLRGNCWQVLRKRHYFPQGPRYNTRPELWSDHCIE